MRSGDSTTQEVPPELAGLLHQFDQIEGAVARASAAAILSQSMALLLAVAAAGSSVRENAVPRPPLNDRQRKVIQILEEDGVTSSTDLAADVGCEPNTIKEWCGPKGVLRHYGVVRSGNKGYGIEGLKTP